MVDEGEDPCGEVIDRGEGATTEELAGEDGEPDLTEPKMIHVLSLVLQRITIPARVPVAYSGSLPPDRGVRLGLLSPG